MQMCARMDRYLTERIYSGIDPLKRQLANSSSQPFKLITGKYASMNQRLKTLSKLQKL